MAKKRSTTKTKKKPAASRPRSAARVNTFKPNGGMPESRADAAEPVETVTIGEAMRLAVEQLGDVKIDDDLAPSQMRQLADAYEEYTRMKAAYEQRAEAAKTAKKSMESASELLLERVKAFTHPAALPLFDQAEAQADLDEMTDPANGETDEATDDESASF